MTPQLFGLMNSIKDFFSKHHPVVFIAIIGLVLAAAVYSLYQVLEITATPTASTTVVTTFNQATVDQIKKLHDSNDATEALVFPTPRSNPFTE